MSPAMAGDPVDAPAATEGTGLYNSPPRFIRRPSATLSYCINPNSYRQFFIGRNFSIEFQKRIK